MTLESPKNTENVTISGSITVGDVTETEITSTSFRVNINATTAPLKATTELCKKVMIQSDKNNAEVKIGDSTGQFITMDAKDIITIDSNMDEKIDLNKIEVTTTADNYMNVTYWV